MPNGVGADRGDMAAFEPQGGAKLTQTLVAISNHARQLDEVVMHTTRKLVQHRSEGWQAHLAKAPAMRLRLRPVTVSTEIRARSSPESSAPCEPARRPICPRAGVRHDDEGQASHHVGQRRVATREQGPPRCCISLDRRRHDAQCRRIGAHRGQHLGWRVIGDERIWQPKWSRARSQKPGWSVGRQMAILISGVCIRVKAHIISRHMR